MDIHWAEYRTTRLQVGMSGADVAFILEDLVYDRDSFFEEYWNRSPGVFRLAELPPGMLDEGEIFNLIDCGLLSRPYFTVFKDGVQAALAELTKTRLVGNETVVNFIDPVSVLAKFSDGATFKLNQLEQWHAGTYELLEALAPDFQAELQVFAFLSPPGSTCVPARTAGAHVFVIQLSGETTWTVANPGDVEISGEALSDIWDMPRTVIAVRPGDVLYVPHGRPHVAETGAQNSLHLAIMVREATAEDVARALLTSYLEEIAADPRNDSHHLVPLPAKVLWIRECMEQFLSEYDVAKLVSTVTASRVRAL